MRILWQAAIVCSILLGHLPLHAQEPELSFSEITKDWDEKYVDAVTKAGLLNFSGDYRGAAEELAPLIKENGAPPALLVFYAEMQERLGANNLAINWYGHAIEAMALDVHKFPWNLRLKRGRLLLLEGWIEDAIVDLEVAWQHAIGKNNFEIFNLLAYAYELQGDHREALSTIEAAIASYPEDVEPWTTWKHLAKKVSTDDEHGTFPPWVPTPPARSEFGKVLSQGYVVASDNSPRLNASEAYSNYSKSLMHARWTEASLMYAHTARRLALNDNLNACETEDSATCLENIAKLYDEPYFLLLPREIKAFITWTEALSHASREDYLHSVAALERLVDIGVEEIPDIDPEGFIITLQREVFTWVTFDSSSGSVRDPDPLDFIDTVDLERLATETEGSPPSLPRNSDFRYGMVSDEEDWANIVAAVVVGEDSEKLKAKLKSIIASRIETKNFELPVKLTLHLFGSTIMDEPLSAAPGDTLHKRLESALSSGEVNAAETTLVGYVVGSRLRLLSERLRATNNLEKTNLEGKEE